MTVITEREVKDLREAYMRAQDASDVEGCLSCWDDDGALMPPNSPLVQGKAAARTFYQDLFSRFKHQVKITFDEIGVSEFWSFAQGHYQGKNVPVEGGEPVHFRGKYLEIHKRQPDGSLKFYRHMFSDDEA